MHRFHRIVDRCLEVFAGSGIAVLVGFTFVQVVGRYVFGRSWGWIEEVSIVILCYTAWVTACLLLRDGRHLSIHIVINRLPAGLRRTVRAALGGVILLFLLIIIYASKGTLEAMEGITFMSFDLPVNIKFFSVPVGATLLIYYQIRNMVTERGEHRHGDR